MRVTFKHGTVAEIETIKAKDLETGDVVIVRCAESLSFQSRMRTKNVLEHSMPRGVKVLVLDGITAVDVYRRGEGGFKSLEPPRVDRAPQARRSDVASRAQG